MAIESLPNPKPQPAERRYPVASLDLFTQYGRADYKEKFKQQAPPFDPKRPIQRWFDTTPQTGNVTYTVFAGDKIQQLTITAEAARTPNLPGKYDYPRYTFGPTKAKTVAPNGLTEGVNPEILVDPAIARSLAQEVVGTAIEAALLEGWTYEWADETRRPFDIEVNGKRHAAFALLKMKYAQGVGAPGHWIATPGGPIWVSEVQPTGETVVAVTPMPIRPLLPNEKLVSGGLFGGYLIERSDVEGEPTGGGGGLTKAQAETLAEINVGVKAIRAGLNV